MNIKHIYFFIGFFLISNISFAESPIGNYLSKLKIFENKDGRKIETYQDVIINLNPFQDRNEEYPIISESEIPEGFVKKSEAKKIFKKLSSNSILTDEKMSFEDFMNENFFLSNEIDSIHISDFPYSLQVSPSTRKLYLCLDDNYRYFSDFKEFPPDSLSCTDCPSLCSKKCKVKKVKRTKVISDWWDDDIIITEDNDKKVHVFGEKNIYSNFRENVLSKANIINADEYQSNKNYIKINIKDRVPPELKNNYALLGWNLNNLCTSGDYYKTDNLEIEDDLATIVYAKFSFGRINDCPAQNEKWVNKEDWSNPENIIKIEKNINSDSSEQSYFNDIIKFSPFCGYLRYSVFSKENSPTDDGNVNPGLKKIDYGQPEIGYGYPLAGDLGNTIESAIDWPDKRQLSDINEKGYETGYIKIVDNDKPNILIRITNTDTEEQFFFPPCDNSNNVKISNSSIYKAISKENGTNKDDYEFFTEKLSQEYDCNYIEKNNNLSPYYRIISIENSDNNLSSESTYINKLLSNKNPIFICENIRLEDYYYSDNTSDGINPCASSDNMKKGELGKRNGTFEKMIVLIENSGSFIFKTGANYKLDVWTDDNIKWTNTNLDNEKTLNSSENDFSNESNVLEEAKVFDTGIKRGTITLDLKDGNNANSLIQQDIDIKKAINGDIYFILKEETPIKRDIITVEELESNNFPSISVDVEDFSGLKRELKLYFRVNDRQINLKTLD